MWEGGWLHTGDLGYLDADGYLFIVGRKKEMIVRGGMNVYADDVEAVLQAHPAVVEAAVIGIPHEVLGEDIAAYVVFRPGETVPTDELRPSPANGSPTTRCPVRSHYLAELPRNAGGKVLKSQLQLAGWAAVVTGTERSGYDRSPAERARKDRAGP